MPRGAADVPAKYGASRARLGVNVEDNFEPPLRGLRGQEVDGHELKSLLKEVDELYLATDGDREGEAIAWHLMEILKPKVPVKRMVFHEITEPAIQAAAASPRELDIDLVDAQETRRILDRLYGYEVSPVLWKKVMPKLSAGRVQSVATRIIVDRERERMAFVTGRLLGHRGNARCGCRRDAADLLVAVGGCRRASASRWAAISAPTVRYARPTVSSCSTSRVPAAWLPVCRTLRSPSSRWRRSPTPDGPTHRS